MKDPKAGKVIIGTWVRMRSGDPVYVLKATLDAGRLTYFVAGPKDGKIWVSWIDFLSVVRMPIDEAVLYDAKYGSRISQMLFDSKIPHEYQYARP